MSAVLAERPHTPWKPDAGLFDDSSMKSNGEFPVLCATGAS